MDRSNRSLWKQFTKHRIGMSALTVLFLFGIIGLYAPFLVSSKPFVVHYDGEWYFPLFRYLFFKGFYTKPLDIFYNLLMFTLPLYLFCIWWFKRLRLTTSCLFLFIQLALFIYCVFFPQHDPGSSATLNKERQTLIQNKLQTKHIQNSYVFYFY